MITIAVSDIKPICSRTGNEPTQDIIDIADRSVVHRFEVGEALSRKCKLTFVDKTQILAARAEDLGHSLGPEEVAVLLGRIVWVVHTVGVQEEKERRSRLETTKKFEASLESAFDIGIGTIRGVGELLESPAEPVPAGHKATFGMSGGPEAVSQKFLRHCLDRLCKNCRRRQHPVLLRIKPGKQSHVGGQSRWVLGNGALEEHSPLC